MDKFLTKAEFGRKTLMRGRGGAYLRSNAYKRKCGRFEDAHYS